MADGKLYDRYPSIVKFETILEDARMAAATDKEEEFVASTKKKYEQWGGRMFWSDAQDRWMRDIAGASD